MSNDAENLRVIEGQGEEPEDALVGQVIDGRYRIESVLGEGGMGLVYRATHVALGKPLAIKVLRPDVSRDTRMIARFRQEAQSASNIGNEHIIDITDFGSLPDGSTYFAMEFLEGRDLTSLIESGGRLAPQRAVHIAKQICMALGAAHERGIVHRDLKPDNIFLVSRGRDPDFVKVLDFGIAKVGGQSSKLTQAGQVFGTPHYMSPEQCQGKGVDHRTDIYALGVILYEMLTGVVPFDADNLMGILTQHLYEEPVPPSQMEPPVELDPALERIVLRCLAKDLDQRYASMEEVLTELESVHPLGSVSHLSAQGSSPQSSGSMAFGQTAAALESLELAPARRSRKRGLLLGGAAVLLLGGTAAAFFLGSSPREEAEARPLLEAPAKPTPAAAGAGATAEEASGQGTSTAAPQGGVEGTGAASPEEHGAPDTAKVSLSTEPVGAEVWMGEELLGNAPLAIPRPAKGEKVELLLRLPGYKDREVRVSAFTAEQVRVRLEKESSSHRRSRRRGRRHPSPPPAPQTKAPQAEPPKPPSAQRTEQPRRRSRVGASEIINPWE